MLQANGHYVLVKQNKIVKKAGTTALDNLGFELVHTDEKISEAAVQIGTVISIGETAWECFGPNFTGKPWAKVGDSVFFPRYAGAVVEDPETGEKFVLLNDKDIQVTISEGENPSFDQKEYKFNPDRES